MTDSTAGISCRVTKPKRRPYYVTPVRMTGLTRRGPCGDPPLSPASPECIGRPDRPPGLEPRLSAARCNRSCTMLDSAIARSVLSPQNLAGFSPPGLGVRNPDHEKGARRRQRRSSSWFSHSSERIRAGANATWSAERVRGELLKLGVGVAKRTIREVHAGGPIFQHHEATAGAGTAHSGLDTTADL